MRLHHDERGQTIILVALSLPLMLGFVGIATDVGALFKDKRTIQTAADAAAIAGALNIATSNWKNAATARATSYGFTDGSNGATVTVHNGPTWAASNYKNAANYIEVTITQSEPTIFLSLFGYPSVQVLARAVATNQGAGNGCVYTLGQTGTDLTVQGSPGVNAPGCDFNIDSSSSNAVTETGSGGSIVTSSIGVVGDIGTSGWADFSPKPVGGIIAASDPLSAMQYPYTCTTSGCTCPSTAGICSTNPISAMPAHCSTFAVVKHGTTNLAPGCYDLGGASGTTIASLDTLSLSNGVYFFTNGTLTIQAGGTFDATNVTMIMTGTAGIAEQGTPAVDLTAADSSGTFPGILYYQVPADIQPLTLNGNSSAIIEGVFYAPGAAVTMQGNAGGTIYASFVVKTLSLLGNPTILSYAQLPGGAAGGLHSVALVE